MKKAQSVLSNAVAIDELQSETQFRHDDSTSASLGYRMIVESGVIWRTANRLMECHGGDALMEAAQRANASRDVGNTDAYKVWLRVAEAVEEWFRGRQNDEFLH